MKTIIAVWLLLVSFNAFATTLNCSSPDGAVTISVFRQDGGAPAPQGTEVLRETWTYKGDKVGSKTNLSGASSDAILGRLGTFNESMRIPIDLSKVGQKPVGEAVYAIQVVAPTYPTNDQTVTLFVICHQVFPTIPYPY